MKDTKTRIEIAQYRLRAAADAVMLAELSRPTMQDWHAAHIRQLLRRAAKEVKEAGAVLPRPRTLFYNSRIRITVDRKGALLVGRLTLSTRQAADLLALWQQKGVARLA